MGQSLFDAGKVDEDEKMSELEGAIKARYPELKGKDWINQISHEDREAFMHEVRSMGLHGVLGGQARARKAKRNEKGEFIPND